MTWTRHENGAGATPTSVGGGGVGGAQLCFQHAVRGRILFVKPEPKPVLRVFVLPDSLIRVADRFGLHLAEKPVSSGFNAGN